VGKIVRRRQVWGQSPQPPEANWDLKAEPPELGEFLQIKKKGILNIF